MESPQWPELPECPVCLQPYDGASTTPRVLACGHSTCETCLTQLPNPFPQTVRCPACTQLVKFPHPQGFSALPKNIDLLRLSYLLQQNPDHKSVNYTEPRKPSKQLASEIEQQLFIPNLWSPEFYSNWKDWVLPKDCVSVDPSGGSSVLYGKIVNFESLFGSPIRCLWKGDQKVSLAKIGLFLNNDDSKFVYSYVAKIMRVLYGMRDGERDELGLILRAGLKQSRIVKVYGLWYNEDDHGVYIVCENYSCRLSENLDYLENGCVGRDEEKMDSSNSGGMLGFPMIGMEICEAVMGLHSEGLISGSLGLACLTFDDFAHACIEINEVLVMGMRVHKMFTKAVSGKLKTDCKELEVSLKNYLLESLVFVSPELFFELLQKEGIGLGSGSPRYVVGYGSDVWSLACVLIWFLVGKPFMEDMHDYFCCLVPLLSDEEEFNCEVLYMGWLEKFKTLLDARLGSEFVSVKENLFKCLDFDPGRRPAVTDIWKCIRGMTIIPKFNMMVSLGCTVKRKNTSHCLVQGELCQLLMEINEGSKSQKVGALQEKDENGRIDVDHVEKLRIDRDLIDGLSVGHVKCIDLKGHLDCITGLAVGGGFLFSSSFDKTVYVWSLKDFTHIHSFKGHEHRVMAVVFVDEEQPLCISGDSGGSICIWDISIPFSEEPIKILNEEKDWRYSGIHALAISGTGHFYTGNGDRSIKAWSMQNYNLSCTLTGHKSVVSTLAVCNGVLYSGSWDGTVRLWCLSDHSPLTVLGENSSGNVTSVLSLAADQHVLIAAHENGHLKIWSDNILLKSTAAQDGAIFSVSMEGKLIFTGGWSKTVTIQELVGDNSSVDAIPIGSIACNSVITALLYWQGTLFVGQADRVIKAYHYEV